jgi:hypothetical protein
MLIFWVITLDNLVGSDKGFEKHYASNFMA